MLISIDTLSPSPIYEQLRNQVVCGIASQKLLPGETLPSVRRLAADLGINFHTVNKSYTMLCDEGYIVMDRRKGAVVARTPVENGGFLTGLGVKMRLAAAEAICHGMSESDFVSICEENYMATIREEEK